MPQTYLTATSSHDTLLLESTGGASPKSRDRAKSKRPINVGHSERQLSLAAGGLLLVTGLSRRDPRRLLMAGLGAALAYRGMTGHCDLYSAIGVNSATPATRSREQSDQELERGIDVVECFLIDKPLEELYSFWRDVENLPRIMTHLKSVQRIDDRKSHWVAAAPTIIGGSVEWDAEITDDRPNSHIAWQSVPGSGVENKGSVQFKCAAGDRGTAVRVSLKYAPPAGAAGRWIAKLFGSDPESLIREDLRNLKRFMEIGEVLTTAGQPRGSCFAGVGRLMH